MKAFISYSHQDSSMLELLHKHLSTLQRDGLIDTWTDKDILPGGKLDDTISTALSDSGLFIALLSPDYLTSKYCYEKEFTKALEMQKDGMIIVPIIIEPCDWKNTPFAHLKAIPADAKAISTWDNKHTAFLDVTQNLRKLLIQSSTIPGESNRSIAKTPRNYRIQKDFDSIERLEFVEKTFAEVKEFLRRYIDEIIQLENIKSRVLIDTPSEFECLLVNRNKIATESTLKVSINDPSGNPSFYNSRKNEHQISYAVASYKQIRAENRIFTLDNDEYNLFWLQNHFYSGTQSNRAMSARDMADLIWGEWLESVGIM